jgi:hypothetical protein
VPTPRVVRSQSLRYLDGYEIVAPLSRSTSADTKSVPTAASLRSIRGSGSFCYFASATLRDVGCCLDRFIAYSFLDGNLGGSGTRILRRTTCR